MSGTSVKRKLLLSAPTSSESVAWSWSALRWFFPFMKRYRSAYIIAALSMPLSALAQAAQPYVVKLAVDVIAEGRPALELVSIVPWFGVALFAQFGLFLLQGYIAQWAACRTIADVRNELFRRLQGRSMRFFDRTPVGQVLTRLMSDLEVCTQLFGLRFLTITTDVLVCVAVSGLMFYLDWRLALVAFTTLLPLVVAIIYFRKHGQLAFRETTASVADLNEYLTEQVRGLETIVSLRKEERCQVEHESINERFRHASRRGNLWTSIMTAASRTLSSAAIVGVILFAASSLGVEYEPASVGTVVAFAEAVRVFAMSFGELTERIAWTLAAAPPMSRVVALAEEDEPDAPPIDVTDAPAVDAGVDISFSHVDFAYDARSPVLEDVSFQVRQGERIGLAGWTGAGKTTIASLLLRLYDPDAGHVLVGGRDVRQWNAAELRRQFSVVSQSATLFEGTVLSNLGADGEDVDRERAEEVLRRVELWELLVDRGGLDAVVEYRGHNFSGGERQLLAAAQALYRTGSIIIFDEATAHVDAATEARLKSATDELLSEQTAIVIAHRLSTLATLDRIVVLHEGRIAETGTHEELLAAGGVYARFHSLRGRED